MKTPFTTLAIALALAGVFAPHRLSAQGPLPPPGPPAPTMKTLDQIEARKPISTAPFVISASGSYYLTNDLSIVSGTAITINADNVTIDLNGYTIRMTGASLPDYAISLGSGRANITILNGFITGNITYSGGSFVGSGYQYGIAASGTAARRVRVEGVTVTGCSQHGIYLDLQSTLIRSCIVDVAGGTGLFAAQVIDSRAVNCGANAITADHADNCTGYAVNSGYGVYSTNASNCDGRSANGTGLFALRAAQNCFGNCYIGSGVALSATSATNCVGVSVNGIGIQAATAENCRGDSFGSNGIDTATADNCYGTSSTSGYGINASRSAKNNSGGSSSGVGLNAIIAESCYGTSSTNIGLNATDAAQNCRGQSTGGSSTATGLNTSNAMNCYGTSTQGRGIVCGSAMNCFGSSSSATLPGISANLAQNCYGTGSGGAGLDTFIAIGCRGSGSPAINSGHIYFSGSGASPYP